MDSKRSAVFDLRDANKVDVNTELAVCQEEATGRDEINSCFYINRFQQIMQLII